MLLKTYTVKKKNQFKWSAVPTESGKHTWTQNKKNMPRGVALGRARGSKPTTYPWRSLKFRLVVKTYAHNKQGACLSCRSSSATEPPGPAAPAHLASFPVKVAHQCKPPRHHQHQHLPTQWLLTASQDICQLLLPTLKLRSHVDNQLFVVVPTPLSPCLPAGDYILETKPKEISEVQRLNYEQVSPGLITAGHYP